MSPSTVPSEAVTTEVQVPSSSTVFIAWTPKIWGHKMLCTATDSRGLGKFLDSACMKLGKAIGPPLCALVIHVSSSN